MALRAEAPVDPSQVYGKAFLKSWVPPRYPDGALRDKTPGTAQIRLVVDERGSVASSRVMDATDGQFGDAAREAVRKWTFTPAIDAGKPAKCSLDTLVVFSPDAPSPSGRMPPPDQMPDLSPTTDAVLESTPDINYPDSLYDRKLSGRAHYFCDVAADGTVSNPRIVAATHVDFVLPALQAIASLKYTPRKQGDEPQPSQVEGEIKFDISRQNAVGALAANMISAPDGTVPLSDVTPISIVDPLWPYDLRLAGKGGTAKVLFTVDVKGVARSVRVGEASDPEFGAALVAAVEMSTFSAPALDGASQPVELMRSATFSVPSADDAASDPQSALLAAEKAGTVAGAGALDTKLIPIFRASPVYPAALRLKGLPEGKATIEFIVDREGRVRLPRIVSATHPEFGWSAATAISQWVFEAPRQKGQPTAVRVRVPFQFKAPSLTEAARL